VYGPNTPSSREADYLVLRAVARSYVAEGLAMWIDRANAIRMLFKRALAIRDQSCRCGQLVMEAYIEGRHWAVAIVEAWALRATISD
jgi:hypothetical protein